jgi:hypothetical protein
MSRSTPDGAILRLHLSPCAIVLERSAPGEPTAELARVVVRDDALPEAMQAIARSVTGPVVAVLPAAAFRARPAGGSRRERRTARAALAVALGLPVARVRAAVATPLADGTPMLVAVAASTVLETVAFLATFGIETASVEPAADLLPAHAVASFDPRRRDGLDPRALAAGLRALPRVYVPSLSYLRGLLPRFPLPRLVIPPAALRHPGRAAAVGASVLAVTVIVGFGLGRPAPETAPAPADAGGHRVVHAEPAPPPPSPVPTAAPEVAPEVALVHPSQPRPRALRPLTLLTSAAPMKRQASPAGLAAAPADTDGPLVVTMASRSAPPPPFEVAPAPAVVPGPLAVSAEAEPAAPETRVAAAGPLPRPSTPPAAVAASEAPGAGDPGLRPVPRPAALTDAGSSAAAPPDSATDDAVGPAASLVRPVARPADRGALEAAIASAVAQTVGPATLTLASLPTVANDASDGLAASVASATRPAPRRAQPVPQVPRATPTAVPSPAPAVTAPPPPATAVARTSPPPAPAVQAPARPSVQARAPQRQVQPQQTARPVAAAAPAAAQPAAPVRGNVSLIGVFGTAAQRHALLRLPNGNIERVRAGQTVAGVQVAAVGGDTVRVRLNGRESVLRMPD